MKPKADLRQHLTAKLPIFVFCLFIIQPLMDVLSHWMGVLNMSNTLTLILRMGVLAVTLLLGFGLSRRKKYYWIAAGIIGFIALGHIFSAAQAGYQNFFTDATNFIRCIQMPVFVLCAVTFIRENEKCYEAMKRGTFACLMIILAVQVLAIVTKTEPHTYYLDAMGYIGWFGGSIANCQSAILSMICPVAIVWVYTTKGMKSPLFWLTMVGGFTSMFFFGTRLCFMGLAAAGFGLGISVILIRPANWKRAGVFLGVCLVFMAFITKSPMYLHQRSYEGFQGVRQEWIDSQVASLLPSASPSPSPEVPEPSASPEPLETPEPSKEPEPIQYTEEELIAALTPVYETHAPDFVEIFGVERTIRMYNFTKDIKEITGLRNRRLQFAKMLMESSPASARLFGIEMARFTVNGNIYDVENDLHGMYYLYGWVGLGAVLAFLGYFVCLIIWALFKNFRKYFTIDAAGWGIAFLTCLAHIYFTAGVLRRPNASFYLSMTLAAIYYLVRIKKYDAPTEVLSEKE